MDNYIIDNALPHNLYYFLKDNINSPDYSWNYIKKTANENDTVNFDSSSLAKRIYEVGFSETCETFPYFHSALMDITSKINIFNYELIRIKAALFLNKNKKIIFPAHVDYHKFEHITILLYFNSFEEEGETIIYKNRYGDKFENLEIEQKIYPKENRIVVFDGLKYHSTTSPISSTDRTIVNFNIKL